MKEAIKNRLPYILLVSIGIFILFFFYGKVILQPNDYMFSNGGDGIKNYYTYAYHIKYDSTYTNFEGMNYPYGENYLYTDCHPVLANYLKFLSTYFPFFDIYSVGIVNILMILSIFFTFIIVYQLMLNLKLNKWLSVFFSIGIGLLAPQLFRMGGHFALSYSIAIPLSWWLILKVIQTRRKRYLVLLFVNNLFWMFIHAYLGVIVISFLLSLWFVKIVSDKEKTKHLLSYILPGLAIILPLVLFYIYTIAIDTHIGRTNNPSGFFLHNAEFDDVFLPFGKPFRPLLDALTGGVIKLKWEARGYVGMVNTLLFIALILVSLVAVFRNRMRQILINLFDNRLLNISLIAAFIVLLFAFAIPFRQFPRLLDILPVFKQFRATGRFVWPFYFVFTLFAAYLFQEKVFNQKGRIKREIKVILLIMVIGVTYVEGFYYHNHVSQSITRNSNLFNRRFLSEEILKSIDKINSDDYQAIISLPFYYYGSETYHRYRQDKPIQNSLIVSYQTGIPTVCANLTRTSIEESKRIVQIVSPNYYNKLIEEDILSEKPFLIVKTGTNFTKYEQAIIAKGKTLSVNERFELLIIDKDELFRDGRGEKIKEFESKQSKLIEQNSFLVTSESSVLYYNSFDNMKSDTVFRGEGCFQSVKNGNNTYAKFPPQTFEKGKEYDLSLWMFNGEQDALNMWFRLIIEEYDEKNDKWHSTIFFPEQAEVINGNWSLLEGVFSVRDSKNWVYIVSKGKEDSKANLHADDLLIKDRGVDVWRFDEQSLFYNNHKIILKKGNDAL